METRQRRSFTDDYKRQAVDLVASSGRSIGSVVPTANQARAYWCCSPPRIGRHRMRPAASSARDIGASLFNDN